MIIHFQVLVQIFRQHYQSSSFNGAHSSFSVTFAMKLCQQSSIWNVIWGNIKALWNDLNARDVKKPSQMNSIMNCTANDVIQIESHQNQKWFQNHKQFWMDHLKVYVFWDNERNIIERWYLKSISFFDSVSVCRLQKVSIK